MIEGGNMPLFFCCHWQEHNHVPFNICYSACCSYG